ncbi:MAG TPA: lysine--tRNA ligase, partial [Candidatus Aerophobetes bacterium]|nr:lysine--tRNA ligase [Candidatus Aerophobetes bacterium]
MGPDKNRLIEVREKKLREWMEKEGNPYWVKFSPDHSTQKIRDKYGNLKAGESVDIEVRLGGRIVAQRGHGKAMFIDIRDGSGKIQAYARKDILKERYSLFKKLELGDIIGVKGKVFKTKTGELTI